MSAISTMPSPPGVIGIAVTSRAKAKTASTSTQPTESAPAPGTPA
jgi:hypothetical protein